MELTVLARRTARIVAVLCAAALVVLWVRLALLGPGFQGRGLMEVGPQVWAVVAIFAGLALWGGWGALHGSWVVAGLCAFVSLVPVGLYFLLFPGLLRAIGVLDLALLASAVVLYRARPAGEEES